MTPEQKKNYEIDLLSNANSNANKSSILPYKPRLSEEFSDDFYTAVYAAYEAGFPLGPESVHRQVQKLDLAAQGVRARRALVRSSGDVASANKLAYNVASLLLLRDLIQIGWSMSINGADLELKQKPLSHDRIIAKQQIRGSMAFERRESLANPSVKDFVRDMERNRYVNDETRSIFSLIADGRQLHKALQLIEELPDADKTERLKTIVSPYLQLVEGDLRDQFTNLRLIDIWRYFRLTWSTPYRPTPGRNVFYLVRDRARPCHPVIGIAALSNCIIGIRCRDDRIGWTSEAIADQVLAAKADDDALTLSDKVNVGEKLRATTIEITELLQKNLEVGIASISHEGITTRNEVAYPTEEGIASISRQAEDATQDRYRHLQEEAQNITLLQDEFELTSPEMPKHLARASKESSLALFRRKRASKLAALLQAKLVCQQKSVFENPLVGLPALLWSDREWQVKNEAGRSCIRTMLNANKESKIGSSMMEITVCGAVAPYNLLLGGKLVAMLLTSPQVAYEYAKRYSDQPSTIASQVAGRDVKRDAHLAFLGTSSLYADLGDKKKYEDGKSNRRRNHMKYSSASQYNRVRIPASIVGEEGEIRYECLGMTEGYGVVHFPSDTREALEELDIIAHQAKRVNSIFGEGTSPRLRKIRQGISLMGLSDEYLVHGQKRLVYGINLAHNTERYLMGVDTTPNYIFPLTDAPKETTEKISDYWIDRWLKVRLNDTNTMQKLESFLPHESAVSREYGTEHSFVPSDLGL